MALLTSGNWSIAGQYATGSTGKLAESTRILGKHRHVYLKLTMASGNWPAAGLPLPNAGSVGMVRNLERYLLNTPKLATASGYRISFGLTTGHNIRALNVPGKQVTASGSGNIPLLLTTGITVASQIFYLTAIGW